MNELERIEQQILELRAKLSHLEQRRQSLLAQSTSLVASAPKEYSPAQKIALFKSYFKGNENCYAHRWQNNKGRSGYAVACHNEWQQGLCNKPKIKCLECPNQAFKSLDEEAIYNHL
ncbi:DNA helicase, partial [Vibrio sp. 10N.261.48.A2]